ncbi:hypothetical protein L914_01311, partial [Phytophthora nicotianae]
YNRESHIQLCIPAHTIPQGPITPIYPSLVADSCLNEDGDLTEYQVCKACGKCRKHALGNSFTKLVTYNRTAHPNLTSDMYDATTDATGMLVSRIRELAANR